MDACTAPAQHDEHDEHEHAHEQLLLLHHSSTQISSGRRQRICTTSSSASSGLDSEPSPTLPHQQQHQDLGIGRPSNTQFDSLHDLLQQAGTISTSILNTNATTHSTRPGIPQSSSDPILLSGIPTVTINPSSPPLASEEHRLKTASKDGPRLTAAASHRPALRKRASRTSHALWTGSLAYRRSHTLAARQSPAITQEEQEASSALGLERPSPRRLHTVGPAPLASSSRNSRPRPSLQAAFASSPTKSKPSLPSTTAQSPTGEDVSARRAEFDAQYQSHRRMRSNGTDDGEHGPSDGIDTHAPSSTTSSVILMAHPALPILSAAPAVALRHEACLIPAGATLSSTAPGAPSSATAAFTEEPQSYTDGQPSSNTSATVNAARPGLGRMRSVDLLRDALDAMLRIRESECEAVLPALAAVDEVGYATTTEQQQQQQEPQEAEAQDNDERVWNRGSRDRTTSSSGTLLSVTHSLSGTGEGTGIPCSPSLPKLFLSSPRGITGPQPIGLESILDPPSEGAEDGSMIEPGSSVASQQLGLGFSFFSLFGRGRTRSAGGSSVSSSSAASTAIAVAPVMKQHQQQRGAAMPPPPEIVIGSPLPRSTKGKHRGIGMISSESIEAELDRMLAGAGAGAGASAGMAPTSPPRRSQRSVPPGRPLAAVPLPGPMVRRSSTDSLEVIKPLRVRRRRRGRAGGDGPASTSTSTHASASGGSSSSSSSSSTASIKTIASADEGEEDADETLRGRSPSRRSPSSSSSSSSSGGMSPSQLDRIESALRGSAGTLSGARKVSALRNDVQSMRVAREVPVCSSAPVGKGGQHSGSESSSGSGSSSGKSQEGPEQDEEETIIKQADEEIDNPFIVKDAAAPVAVSVVAPSPPPASSIGVSFDVSPDSTSAKAPTFSASTSSERAPAPQPASSNASTHADSPDSPVRRFLASLVELETPGRPFQGRGAAGGADEEEEGEGEEDVLGPLVPPSGAAAGAAASGPARGVLSERSAQENLDGTKSSSARGKAGCTKPQASAGGATASPKDQQENQVVAASCSHLSDPPLGAKPANAQAATAAAARPRSRRKTILTISHSDVRRRPVSITTTTTTTSSSSQPQPSTAAASSSSSSFRASTPPTHAAEAAAAVPNLADLLDSTGRMRPHVVLVAEQNGASESPTSAMLAQRGARRSLRASGAGAGGGGGRGRALRNAASQPVLGGRGSGAAAAAAAAAGLR
ncbi:hypothetical protein OC834_002376 [Tilletia horrida]|nr:hypothetical protein OC834_002376 [Tilletia horrida]